MSLGIGGRSDTSRVPAVGPETEAINPPRSVIRRRWIPLVMALGVVGASFLVALEFGWFVLGLILTMALAGGVVYLGAAWFLRPGKIGTFEDSPLMRSLGAAALYGILGSLCMVTALGELAATWSLPRETPWTGVLYGSFLVLAPLSVLLCLMGGVLLLMTLGSGVLMFLGRG